jgi:citrate lyase beta subunit
MATPLRPRRSLLFVPGGDARKLQRAAGAGADTLIFDLEDSVLPARKREARDLVAALLRQGGFGPAEPAVRVNPPGTPEFELDLATVVAAGARAILVPKCESAAGLAQLAAQLEEPVRLLALLESAAGVVAAAQLAAASPRVDALCFGHADFCLDMGLQEADASRGSALHARCAIAIAARAARVAAIDTVCLDVRSEAAFRSDAALGAELGFEGKLCLHPAQVAIANDLFTPTRAQIEDAQRVVEGFDRAREQGRGVFVLDDRMVDAPLVAQKRRVLERARQAGVL